jgi:MFS family permease
VSNSPFRRVAEISAPDFWRLWYVGLIVSTVRWLEAVAIGIVVYERTDSAFLVSMMTMLRVLPMGLFGAFLGALADRFDRGRTLLVVVLSMGVTSLVLAVLGWTGRLEVWHLALASFIGGCGWCTDNPVRRVLIGEVVGRERMATAMSLDIGANNASRMLGPAFSGVLLTGTGIQGAFILSVAMYCTALWAVYAIRTRFPRAASSAAMLAQIAEGFALVRTDPRIIGVLVVTVIYNIFAWPFTSMIPVIGRDRLHLGPEGVGLLATMDGAGAFIGVVLLALWLSPKWYGRTFIYGVICYLVVVVIFALVPSPALAAAALLMSGLAGAGFATTQATLVYLAAPPEMRSRVLGVLTVCIGTGPIGFLWLGWLADRIGSHNATALTGSLGLLALAATWRWWNRTLA